MKKLEFVNCRYEKSDSRVIQGNSQKVEPYLKEGYFIKESRNGYWVLIKPAQVIVTFKNGDKIQKYNLKTQICDLYDKRKISEKTVQKFQKDAEKGKIEFYHKDGYIIIK